MTVRRATEQLADADAMVYSTISTGKSFWAGSSELMTGEVPANLAPQSEDKASLLVEAGGQMEAESRHLKLEVRPIAGIEELRRLVLEARKSASSNSLASGEPISSSEGSELEALLARAPEHAHALTFPVDSRLPVVAFAVRAAKRFFRRLARTYLDRQSAVNEYLLALTAATARAQLRSAAAHDAEIRDLRARCDALISRLADHGSPGELPDPSRDASGAMFEAQQAVSTEVPQLEVRAERDVPGGD